MRRILWSLVLLTCMLSPAAAEEQHTDVLIGSKVLDANLISLADDTWLGIDPFITFSHLQTQDRFSYELSLQAQLVRLGFLRPSYEELFAFTPLVLTHEYTWFGVEDTASLGAGELSSSLRWDINRIPDGYIGLKPIIYADRTTISAQLQLGLGKTAAAAGRWSDNELYPMFFDGYDLFAGMTPGFYSDYDGASREFSFGLEAAALYGAELSDHIWYRADASLEIPLVSIWGGAAHFVPDVLIDVKAIIHALLKDQYYISGSASVNLHNLLEQPVVFGYGTGLQFHYLLGRANLFARAELEGGRGSDRFSLCPARALVQGPVGSSLPAGDGRLLKAAGSSLSTVSGILIHIIKDGTEQGAKGSLPDCLLVDGQLLYESMGEGGAKRREL